MMRHILSRITRCAVFLILVFGSLFSAAAPAGVGSGNGNLRGIGTVVGGMPLDNKVDPGLRFMESRYRSLSKEIAGSPSVNTSANTLYDGSLFFRLLKSEQPSLKSVTGISPTVEVFLKLKDQSAIGGLQRLGVEVICTVGDIAIAHLPILRTYDAAALDNVLSIQISSWSRPLLDISRAEAKVDVVHAGGGGLSQAYKGKDVIVGIIDSGIDWKHADFSATTGDTRILWLLDYANGPQTGQEWTKAQIDLNPSPVVEIDGPGGGGHGTHVSGIAVGSGKRNPGYIGMAPESDIIFVKGIRDQDSNGGFSDADVVSGVDYIFKKAASLGKPAVVNLSLGGQYGPHDGTSLYEQALSSLVNPGRIIVAAAGNEGSDQIHLSYTASGSDLSTARQTLWIIPRGTTSSLVDLWYAAGNISVGIAAYLVQGGQLVFLGNTTPVAPGQSMGRLPFVVNGTTLAMVAIDARTTADPNNGAKRVIINIDSDGQYDLSLVAWALYTLGDGSFDAWVATGGYFSNDSSPSDGIMPGDNNESVGTPSTAKKVVCVGSYATKTTWIDFDGNTRVQQGVTLGKISSFSSLGPSRDGRSKPDIVAPGEVIVSALSSSANAQNSSILQGGGLQELEGTSMASPHVAGIVALMLQRNRYLTYESVLALLTSTASGPGQPNVAGAGKVNALNALLATPPGVDCASLGKITGYDCEGNKVVSYALYDAYPNPFNPSTTISFSLLKPEPAELAVYDMLGRRVRTVANGDLADGSHTVVWDGRDGEGRQAASGVYFYRLTTPSFTASNRVVLLK